MKRLAQTVSLLVFGLLVLVPGPARAANGENLDRLSDELSALTDAVRAEIRLQRLYDSLDRKDAAGAARRRLGELLARQRDVLRRIAARIGETPPPPQRPVSRVGPAAKGTLGSVRPGREPAPSVRLGLDWLRRHQDREGSWDCDGFMKHDDVRPACDGPGYSVYDPGVTGLALLAFLGAGQTYRGGAYKATVGNGLRYLKQIQDQDGCYGPRSDRHFIYSTAICTLAMSEAYGLTGSPLFKPSAQKGVDFLQKAQNPYLAWRYGVRPGDNDTAVTGWCVAALKSGKAVGLRVDTGVFQGALAWLDKVTEPEYGRVGYTSRGSGPARSEAMQDKYPPDKSESLTAEGIVIRVLCGEDARKSELIRKGTELCLKVPPLWNESSGSIDMYYWYWGTLAMFQVGGRPWQVWSAALKKALLGHQRQDGAFRGSFDPAGPWGPDGGRIYSTALCLLSLEVAYRAEAEADHRPPRRGR